MVNNIICHTCSFIFTIVLFQDTIRRCKDLDSKGILYVGSGVSGGEEGARHGPSLMPGGNPKAWPYIAPIFQVIQTKLVSNCVLLIKYL